MAAAPAHEPTRARARGGDLDQAPELPGNRALAALARHGLASCRAAGRSAARAQRAAAGGRLRAGVPRASVGRSRLAGGARRGRPGAARARALSGARGRPSLDHGRGQPRGHAPAGRRSRRSAPAARQRAAAEPASRWACAAHRQSGRMARAPHRTAAPAGGGERRRDACRAVARALRLSGAAAPAIRVARGRSTLCRGGGAAPPGRRRRRAVVLLDHHGVRNAG